MAFAIVNGLLAKATAHAHMPQAAQTLHVIDPNPQAATRFGPQIPCTAEWPTGLQAEQVVLAVKPQMMQAVLTQYKTQLQGTLLISIAAGVRVEQLQNWSGQPQAPVARVMPNTPALVGQGMTGIYFTPHCTSTQRQSVQTMFEACGQTMLLEEEQQINALTAISGSGPGYVFFLMEALQNAAQSLGFAPAQAHKLVTQTFLGAATLACQSPEPLSTLRENVTSKGGTTFAGLEVLRKAGVEKALHQAAQQALARAIECKNKVLIKRMRNQEGRSVWVSLIICTLPFAEISKTAVPSLKLTR
ncbi:MAG: pyrroline-5-carboxylate reductase [Limnobacter sp.]|nr:pyrroline-5-carboxylate reductase [Limnobacter sp.]